MVSAIYQHASATGTRVPHYEPPSYLPPYPIPLGCPRALALDALLHALGLHWSSILHVVMYMFQCYSRFLALSLNVCSLCLAIIEFEVSLYWVRDLENQPHSKVVCFLFLSLEFP